MRNDCVALTVSMRAHRAPSSLRTWFSFAATKSPSIASARCAARLALDWEGEGVSRDPPR